jgi:predicted metal-dependent phosphoesterase TrpH
MAIKIELHAHTSDDPVDRIPHTTRELIDHAALLKYGALAITLHDRQLDLSPHLEYARALGIILLRGIERTVEGRHLLLINFPQDVEQVETFADVAELKARTRGLVIAPHPYYPVASSMGRVLDQHADLVDAVEWNAMYTKTVDFNRAAARWAGEHGKPLVGNTDLHLLSQMGTTWSEVEAGLDADSICGAIRSGRVRVHTTPVHLPRAAWIFANMVVFGWLGPRKVAK